MIATKTDYLIIEKCDKAFVKNSFKDSAQILAGFWLNVYNSSRDVYHISKELTCPAKGSKGNIQKNE
jgi:hypothetical protein